MFLKSLTLKGFKSFAETTTLELEPGVTVVVGPNGSGKSNVVDAIGWVLGAQAPSAVRSQKMDDVIFAGTAKRPALGRAEVSLTIDNSAGLLPLEFSEVTLTRTLFRTGESDYAINGVPCRLLDIQDLLSDTGVGRQQHVIVSQGQIDAVLNARPEDRRLILEEAAGVLKFRKRKEKAERRLAATEGNLTRLQDLLREVRRQLRPLERQAEAARRHGDVVAELRALKVFLAGRQIGTLQRRLADSGAARTEQTEQTERLRGRLAELDSGVLAAEADLGRSGGDDIGDALSRFESLAREGQGVRAVLTERRRGIERERSAFVDQAVVASLETDAARLTAELADCETARVALEPRAAEIARADRDLAEARAIRIDAEAQVGRAEEGRRFADAEQHAWAARAEALSLALDEDRRRAGLDRLSTIEGVVGSLIGLVEIDGGWELAVEAAAGEALGGVVVESVDAARAALDALARDDDLGAVVVALAERPPAPPPPPLGEPVRRHVRTARTEIEPLLDSVLGQAVAVEGGWRAALDASVAHPHAIVVTLAGDRFSSFGWRVGPASGGATYAALEEARRRAASASEAARRAEATLLAARAALEQARQAEARAVPEVAALRRDVDVRTAGIDERAALLQRRLAEVDERLEGSVVARRDAEGRRVELDRMQLALDRLNEVVADRLVTTETTLADLRERRRRQSDAQRAASARLEEIRRDRVETERTLEETRERASRSELAEAEVRLRLESAIESLRRDLEVEPDAAIGAPLPDLPEGVTPAARARDLERDLRLMGPINPLALEEFDALQERHEFLQAQLDDVKASRRDLARVIRAVDGEIVAVFAAAFADVSTNFELLFDTLFPGGRGRLRLTQPGRPADDGHRGRGQAVGQERAQALAAVRRRAVSHRTGVSLRCVPQPALALLRHGRGRSRARRRQPAPLPRSRRRVPT